MKVRSQYNPPEFRGEVFTEPSMTDQLANEPLSDIVKRFTLPQIVGGYLKQDASVILNDETLEADLEAAFDDFAEADLPLMSKADQAAALVDAQVELERLQKVKASQRSTEPVKPQKLPEEKEASKDSDKA